MVPRILAIALIAMSLPLSAQTAAPAAAPSRGELLYQTHCVSCHDTQVHWRDRKIVADWPSLVAEVRRWQANLGLDWSGETIDEVSRYLNDAIYRLPDLSPKQTG